MVATYTIMGRQVGSHVLAMATLGTAFVGGYLSMGGSKKAADNSPPINASSKEEESFVKDFLKKDDHKTKA